MIVFIKKKTDIPPEAKGNFFAYEILSVDSSSHCTLKFLNQIICPGGNEWRVFKEGSTGETQVSCIIIFWKYLYHSANIFSPFFFKDYAKLSFGKIKRKP
jgi:hypothetical protein